MTTINEAMNLVIPIYGEGDAITGYVHSIPIGRAVFEANYRLLGATFVGSVEERLADVAGPAFAELILRDAAATRGIDPEPLLNEIRRLTYFLRSAPTGWEMIPFYEAATKGQISESDAREVMGALVFFTSVWASVPRRRAMDILPGAAKRFGAELTLLAPMAWTASLATSTGTGSSGVTVTPDTVVPEASQAATVSLTV